MAATTVWCGHLVAGAGCHSFYWWTREPLDSLNPLYTLYSLWAWRPLRSLCCSCGLSRAIRKDNPIANPLDLHATHHVQFGGRCQSAYADVAAGLNVQEQSSYQVSKLKT